MVKISTSNGVAMAPDAGISLCPVPWDRRPTGSQSCSPALSHPFLMFGVVGMFAIGLAGFTWKRADRNLEESQLDSKLLREEWPRQGQR